MSDELGDAQILKQTVINNGESGWVATYTPDDGEPTIRGFTEKPKGAAISSFCDEVRRVTYAKQESATVKARRARDARQSSDKGSAAAAGDGGGVPEATEENNKTFKEEVEARQKHNLAQLAEASMQIVQLKSRTKILELEKAGIEAALEVLNNDNNKSDA